MFNCRYKNYSYRFEHVSTVAQIWTGRCLQGWDEEKKLLAPRWERKSVLWKGLNIFKLKQSCNVQANVLMYGKKLHGYLTNHSEIFNLNSLEGSSSSITWLCLASSERSTTDPSKFITKEYYLQSQTLFSALYFPTHIYQKDSQPKQIILFWYTEDLWHLQRED